MLEIKCDFCGEKITTKQNKGGEVIDFRLEENICNKCKKLNLLKKWEEDKSKVEKKWQIIERERKRFANNLLKHQKEKWMKEKKKEYLGSFYTEGG